MLDQCCVASFIMGARLKLVLEAKKQVLVETLQTFLTSITSVITIL